ALGERLYGGVRHGHAPGASGQRADARVDTAVDVHTSEEVLRVGRAPLAGTLRFDDGLRQRMRRALVETVTVLEVDVSEVAEDFLVDLQRSVVGPERSELPRQDEVLTVGKEHLCQLLGGPDLVDAV